MTKLVAFLVFSISCLVGVKSTSSGDVSGLHLANKVLKPASKVRHSKRMAKKKGKIVNTTHSMSSKVYKKKVHKVKVQPVKVQPVKVQPVKVHPVKVHSHRSHKCASLSGVAQMQCIASKAANKIQGICLAASSAIIKEASVLSSKIKTSSNLASVKILNHKFGFVFLQRVDKARNCNRMKGLAKLDCLAMTAASDIKTTGVEAANRINSVANATAKEIVNVTSIINDISGFENIFKQINSATITLLKHASILALKIKSSSQHASVGIQQAAGYKKSLLETSSNSMKMKCTVLSGVAHMNCLARNAANKMAKTGNIAAKAFMKEATNLARQIRVYGSHTASYIKQENKKLTFIQIKNVLEKLSYIAMINLQSEKVAPETGGRTKTMVKHHCHKFTGIPKLECIAKDASNQLKKSASASAKEISAVAYSSALTVVNVAAKVRKISGFENISKEMAMAAGLLKLKGNKLAKKVVASGNTAAYQIQRVVGLPQHDSIPANI